MERDAVLETVLERARERLGAPELGPDDAFHGLGVDSLMMVDRKHSDDETVQLRAHAGARSATPGPRAHRAADRA